MNIIQLLAGNYDLTQQVAVISGGNTVRFNIVTPIVIQGPDDESTASTTPASPNASRIACMVSAASALASWALSPATATLSYAAAG